MAHSLLILPGVDIYRHDSEPSNMFSATTVELMKEIDRRLGYFPALFVPATEDLTILANLWQQTVHAYLDNPLQKIFKEKLCVALSLIRRAPYNLRLHSSALWSYGFATPEIIEFLQAASHIAENGGAHKHAWLKSSADNLPRWPDPDSAPETELLGCSIRIFLGSTGAGECQKWLRDAVTPTQYGHLLMLLSYMTTCLAWEAAHPEISDEMDAAVRENLPRMFAEDRRFATLLALEEGSAPLDERACRHEDAVTPAHESAEAGLDLSDARILVVEDDADVRAALTNMLAESGALVTAVRNEPQALSAISKARDQRLPFRLILVQCRMPGLKNFNFAAYFDGASEVLARTVVMLPADHLANDPARIHDLGFAAHLAKPVSRDNLQKVLSTVMIRQRDGDSRQVAVQSLPAAPPVSASATGLAVWKILVVDDSSDARTIVQQYLRGASYDVDTAADGPAAIAMYREHPYDLVIMDVQMPGMDGYEATMAIREWERQTGSRPAPILTLTAHSATEDAQKSLRAGCSAYLTKPITKATLISAVDKQLNRRAKD